jgi:hypothetical protein
VEGGSLTYVANFAAMLCVQTSNFSGLARDGEAVHRVGQFRDRMDEVLLNCPHVAHFSTVGVTEYLLVDADLEQGGPADAAACAWTAAQVIMRVAIAADVQVQFGMSAGPGVVMGLMALETLSFGVFAKMTRVARIMALRARPGVLVVDKMAFPAFPGMVGISAAPVTFMNGAVNYAAFECSVPAIQSPSDLEP